MQRQSKTQLDKLLLKRKYYKTFLYNEKIFIKGIPVVTVVIFANDDAKLSESFIADDANQAVLELDTLLPFIHAKEQYLEEMPSRSRSRIIKKLEKKINV